MKRSITAAVVVAAGLLTVLTEAARADAPVATLPAELLGYDLQGVSLKTDPAAVHGILVSRGFELVPGSDKMGTSSTGVSGTYERGYSMRERRGERITYEDKLSGPQQAVGGSAVARQQQRSIWYQHLFPLGTVSDTQRSWSENPDRRWVEPLFDQLCPKNVRAARGDTCLRESGRLAASVAGRATISLTPSETSVKFAQISLGPASGSRAGPTTERPLTSR